MKDIYCTRRLQFCAGHRVMKHESKCAHLHGHNYVGLFTAQGPLDRVGRVIDFGVLKERIGGWIDEHWDHGLILNREDGYLINTFKEFRPQTGRVEIPVIAHRPPQSQKLYLMKKNPTAENMAAHLLRDICPDVLADTGVTVTRVRLWETENCYADAEIK